MIYPKCHAFAAVGKDVSLLSWGSLNFGGDNSVQAVLVIVGNIYSTPFTFAAVLKDYAFTAFLYDGSVATWTSKHFGVNSIVETVLLGSVMILLTS